ncbi:MAG: nucleotidyltransferase domain-containing protein [Actinobacteria bacterium]|nr:nucleotidyltransferase domain-containing protein [Actinomycetota bacterium]
MTFDPREGIGPDKCITTGVHPDRIPAKYGAVIDEIIPALASVDDDILAIYLYGSVATGMATPPTSDLDLLAVLNEGRAASKIRHLASELSERHRELVREVAIATVVISDTWSDSVDGLGSRCFLKHYCAHLYGLDVRQDIKPCRATPERNSQELWNGTLITRRPSRLDLPPPTCRS